MFFVPVAFMFYVRLDGAFGASFSGGTKESRKSFDCRCEKRQWRGLMLPAAGYCAVHR